MHKPSQSSHNPSENSFMKQFLSESAGIGPQSKPKHVNSGSSHLIGGPPGVKKIGIGREQILEEVKHNNGKKSGMGAKKSAKLNY